MVAPAQAGAQCLVFAAGRMTLGSRPRENDIRSPASAGGCGISAPTSAGGGPTR